MEQRHHQIRADQSRHGIPPDALDRAIERTVTRVLAALADRPAPVQARYLRSEAASRYLGKHDEYLAEDRRDARREGRPPRFPFKTLGASVLYDLRALDEAVAALPEGGVHE